MSVRSIILSRTPALSNFVPRPETRLVFLTEGSFCGSKTPRGAPVFETPVFETAKRPRGQKNNAEFLCRVYEYFFPYQVQNTDLVSRSDISIWTFFANAHLQGCLRICFGPHVRGFEARLSPAEAGLSYPATVTRWLAIFLLKSSNAKFLHIHSFIRLEFN